MDMQWADVRPWLLHCADIHDVSPQMGSVKGGAVVTVTGTGFLVDALDDIAVDIDGIPCRASRIIH